jgi:hypothetical protein
MANRMLQQQWIVGPDTVDSALRTIAAAGSAQSLQAKAFRILQIL